MGAFLRNERGGAARWIIIIIVVAAGIYGYQQFKKTPRYALIQVKKAILFSNAETAQEFMDFDKIVPRLPDSVTRSQPLEVVKKQLIYEIDSPHEKSFFNMVKGWSVIRAPITIGANNDTAAAETTDKTTVSLEKTPEGRWVVTAIEMR